MHKANKKTTFSTQEEIDWGAVPSRLCNEMRSRGEKADSEGQRRSMERSGGWRRERKEK